MKKNGTITIEGKDITVRGSDKIVVQARNDMALKANKILENQAVRWGRGSVTKRRHSEIQVVSEKNGTLGMAGCMLRIQLIP